MSYVNDWIWLHIPCPVYECPNKSSNQSYYWVHNMTGVGETFSFVGRAVSFMMSSGRDGFHHVMSALASWGDVGRTAQALRPLPCGAAGMRRSFSIVLRGRGQAMRSALACRSMLTSSVVSWAISMRSPSPRLFVKCSARRYCSPISCPR